MNNFLRLIGRRLVALPIMALGVTVLVFFLMSFSKTDPAYTALGDGASPEAVAEYHEKYGLDDPWPVRYVRYMGNLIHGDMGTYGAARNSVAKRISTALPVTMQLTFIGLAIGAVVSFLLGVIAALYRDKWPDQVIRVFSIAGLATPSFWLAVLLILLFSSYLKVLPASGALPHFTTNPAGYLGDGKAVIDCMFQKEELVSFVKDQFLVEPRRRRSREGRRRHQRSSQRADHPGHHPRS